jgi:hypothetical protein
VKAFGVDGDTCTGAGVNKLTREKKRHVPLYSVTAACTDTSSIAPPNVRETLLMR